jgi:hypothetical protein
VEEHIKVLEKIHQNYGKVMREMLEETPEPLLDVIADAENKQQLRQGIYALFMSFLTYLFQEERLVIKRKDTNGTINQDR